MFKLGVYMKNITNNEIRIMLAIFKSPDIAYNANSMSKLIGISPMGALKIMKKLEKENILNPKKLGKAKFYSLNLSRKYVRDYIAFLLQRESEQHSAYARVWINEIKSNVKSAEIAILFGSVLKKGDSANDVDVLLVTNKESFLKLKKEVEKVNLLNIKKLHPIYQSIEDLKRNIKKNDAVALSAIKGIVAFGAEKLVEVFME